jgi:Mycoplasma protein of unknown function, DUF285
VSTHVHASGLHATLALGYGTHLKIYLASMSKVVSTNTMLAYAYSFNGDVSTWNMSNNRDFGLLFTSCTSFNGDLSAWDVSYAEIL